MRISVDCWPTWIVVALLFVVSAPGGLRSEVPTEIVPKMMPPDVQLTPSEFSSMPIVSIPKAGGVAKRQLKCSTTIIGPRVLLTAAHCIAEGRQTVAIYRASQKTFPKAGEEGAKSQQTGVLLQATCIAHPLAVSGLNPTADFALCLLEKPELEMRAEWMLMNAYVLPLIERLHLAGFGCQSIKERKKSLEGEAIKYAASQHERAALGIRFAAGPYRDNFIPMIYSRPQPTICEGDSGGVAIVNLDSNFMPDNRVTKQISRRRVVVAVNSGYVARNESVALVAALASPDFREFLTWWRGQNKFPLVCDLELRSEEMRRACRPLD